MSAVLELLGAHACEATKQSFGTAAKLREQLLALADDRGVVLAHSERSWRSATYAGTRHIVSIEFAGHSSMIAGEAMLAALPSHEFILPGELVCEATIKSAERKAAPVSRLTAIVELLLLEKG
ncbi:hypothetical protein E3U23_11260 [Erythrobacter litoralis]|uniref:hypothetical protein n=1 Tax=Erythrobacter litoralis TaxID=39960 RepID=UPI002434B165|nr:hypothetical protein [Erythrobacter litoralis]MDG6079767.1 hypothetical protein [Erythrobacter litoralis]